MMTDEKNNGSITIEPETQKDLQDLYRLRNEVDIKIQIILRTVMNQLNKKGDYKINESLTRLEPVIKKED